MWDSNYDCMFSELQQLRAENDHLKHLLYSSKRSVRYADTPLQNAYETLESIITQLRTLHCNNILDDIQRDQNLLEKYWCHDLETTQNQIDYSRQ